LKLISLEDAIRKMTSLPAQTFGFRDRGLIREGFAADLVIFDENTIIDQATFDKPHQFPLGISYVLVNGAPIIENNQLTAARPGVALHGAGLQGTAHTWKVQFENTPKALANVSRIGAPATILGSNINYTLNPERVRRLANPFRVQANF
jgi:hypothetical protein